MNGKKAKLIRKQMRYSDITIPQNKLKKLYEEYNNEYTSWEKAKGKKKDFKPSEDLVKSIIAADKEKSRIRNIYKLQKKGYTK